MPDSVHPITAMTINRLRIATRKSPLALWQAEFVRDQLQQLYPHLTVTLVPLSTRGDKILDAPLAKVGGKALFVKELEQALLNADADIAVHSGKDVPVELPDGLDMPVILKRHDPRDALVSNEFSCVDALPEGARVGTSSVRRQCQLLALRPDLKLADLRGNVGTRLAKLDAGDFDAIILASAGLDRMALDARIRERIDPARMIPAIAQGAMTIECRASDEPVRSLIAALNDAPTRCCVEAERAMNRRLMGGCQVPVAGYARIEGEQLHLRGMVGRPDGTGQVFAGHQGPVADPSVLGDAVAGELLQQGAGDILEAFYGDD